MAKCCDTCGNIGIADALDTCSRCKTSRHKYCMSSLAPYKIWCCEECDSGSEILPQKPSSLTRVLPCFSKPINSVEANNVTLLPKESKKQSEEPKKGPVDWEKKVVSGKTKYISVTEAMRLSSGASKPLPHLNVPSYSNFPHPQVGPSKLDRTPKRPKNIPPKISSQQDHASRPSRQLIPQRICTTEFSVGQQQLQSPRDLQRVVNSCLLAEAPIDDHMQEQPAEVKLLQTKTKILMKQPSFLSETSLDTSPVTQSAGTNSCTILELRTTDNMNVNVVPASENCSYTPSLDALWNGSFNIQDDLKLGRLSHEIQAHSPSLVRRKVYDFSKQMPEMLNLELVPCEKIWLKLFPDYSPDRRDIGLYFFPSNSFRDGDYTSLLECITKNNLALRKQIADVELLVFASKLLPVDCQYWQGKNFLWGVFHKLKGNVPTSLIDKKPGVQNSDEVNYGCNNENASTDVDMDIDMIGGKNVGRVDVVVQYTSSKGQSSTAECGIFVARDKDSVVPSISVKLGPRDDIPPGFEERFRQKIIDCSPFVKDLKEELEM